MSNLMIKRKQEPTTTISVRIPVSVKVELDNLRKIADKADIDFAGTLAEMIASDLKTIRTEIEGLERKTTSHASNGAPGNREN